MPRWQVYQGDTEDNVIPENDIGSHYKTADCSCCPTSQQWNGKTIIIHRAWDLREHQEEAIASAFGRGRN